MNMKILKILVRCLTPMALWTPPLVAQEAPPAASTPPPGWTPPNPIQITVTRDMLQTIGTGVLKLPMETAAPIINHLQEQLNAADQASAKQATDAAAAEVKKRSDETAAAVKKAVDEAAKPKTEPNPSVPEADSRALEAPPVRSAAPAATQVAPAPK